MELGVAGCLFEHGYESWNKLATDFWVKLLWERIQKFDLAVGIDYKTFEIPRENDKCIMKCLIRKGFQGDELVSINWAIKHQDAHFMSDIATAKGPKIEGLERLLRRLIRQAPLAVRIWLRIPAQSGLSKLRRRSQKYHTEILLVLNPAE